MRGQGRARQGQELVCPLVLAAILVVCTRGQTGVCTTSESATCVASAATTEGLNALYAATAGEHWTYNTGWTSTANPCDGWTGVFCAEDGSTVGTDYHFDYNCQGYAICVYLSLDNNNLSGTIPPGLFAGDEFPLVFLQRNSLYGTLPPELFDQSRLFEIYLYHNSLSGTIPPLNGGVTTRLANLLMNSNRLSGTLPELSALTALLNLAASHNQLSGTIPSIPAKQYGLLLGHNRISGTAPLFSGTAPTVLASNDDGCSWSTSNIDFDSNPISGTIPSSYFTGDPNREWLIMSNTRVSGTIPENIIPKYLFLSDTRISGTFPELPDSSVVVVLHKMRLSGTLPDLARLTNVQSLTMHENSLQGRLSIPANQQLGLFFAFNNRFSGQIQYQALQQAVTTGQGYYYPALYKQSLVLNGNWFDANEEELPDWMPMKDVTRIYQSPDWYFRSGLIIPLLLLAGTSLFAAVFGKDLFERYEANRDEASDLTMQYLFRQSKDVIIALCCTIPLAIALMCSYFSCAHYYSGSGPVMSYVSAALLVVDLDWSTASAILGCSLALAGICAFVYLLLTTSIDRERNITEVLRIRERLVALLLIIQREYEYKVRHALATPGVDKWYFAIGAMMSPSSLKAHGLYPKESRPGVLVGYRVQSGFVTPVAGKKTLGVLHLLPGDALRRLDHIMGDCLRRSAKARFYDRTELMCTVYVRNRVDATFGGEQELRYQFARESIDSQVTLQCRLGNSTVEANSVQELQRIIDDADVQLAEASLLTAGQLTDKDKHSVFAIVSQWLQMQSVTTMMSSERKRVNQQMHRVKRSQRMTFSGILLKLLWLVLVSPLSVVTVLYVFAFMVPPDNTLHLPLALLEAFGILAPLLLTLIDGVILPNLAGWYQRVTDRGDTTSFDLAQYIALAGIFTQLVVPTLVVILMDTNCFDYWTVIWDRCYEGFFQTGATVHAERCFGSFDLILNIITPNDVCGTGIEPHRYDRCSRATLEYQWSLIGLKMIYQMTLTPCIKISMAYPVVDRFISRFKSTGGDGADRELSKIYMTVAFGLVFGPVVPVMIILAILVLIAHFITLKILVVAFGQVPHAPQITDVSPESTYRFCGGVLLCWVLGMATLTAHVYFIDHPDFFYVLWFCSALAVSTLLMILLPPTLILRLKQIKDGCKSLWRRLTGTVSQPETHLRLESRDSTWPTMKLTIDPVQVQQTTEALRQVQQTQPAPTLRLTQQMQPVDARPFQPTQLFKLTRFDPVITPPTHSDDIPNDGDDDTCSARGIGRMCGS